MRYASVVSAWLLVLCCLLLGADNVLAKWWIFGQSGKEMTTSYLYLNDISYDELGPTVTLYRELLPEGQISIRGRMTSGGGGVLQVSLDNKATWNKAVFDRNGAFFYTFAPEIGQTYEVYVKAIDTSGKTNDFEATRKEITVTQGSAGADVRQALDAMIGAYMAEDGNRFMAYVHPDFAGDAMLLDTAVRRDFSLFDNIDLRYTLSGLAVGGKGSVHVSIAFNRRVNSSRSGEPLTDSGTTEFVFRLGTDGAQVFSMKNPLIFGLSDAENIATGTVVGNDQVLTVNPDGSVTIGSPASVVGIPSPTNLRATNMAPNHHQVDLEFDTTLDVNAGQGVYETVVEESLSATGPWIEVERTALDTTIMVMSNNIASQSAILYYRVRIENIADSDSSQPSNVISFDNR